MAVWSVAWGQAAEPRPTAEKAQAPAAQAPAPPAPANQAAEESPDFAARVERVHVPFTVTDGYDRYVTDLTRDHFTVYENGKQVEIDFFTPMSSLPLRVGLLLDTSNSIRLMFKAEQEAAIDFVHELLEYQTKHRAFLMTFDTGKDVIKDFTSDPNELADGVRKLRVGGGTALFDAIYEACEKKLMKVDQPDGVRRVLLLITDGEDVASRYSIEQTIDIAQRAQVSIYSISTISYGDTSPGDKVLQQLAEETGGRVVAPWKKPPSAEFGTGYLSRTQIGNQNAVYEAGTGKYAGEIAANLAMALKQIHVELNRQYTIGYKPPNPMADGRFREIRVEPRIGGLKVRARKGYYANSSL